MSLRELIAELQELDAKYAEYHKDTDLYLSTNLGDDVPLDYIDSVVCPLIGKDKKVCRIVFCASVSIPDKKKKRVKKYDAPRTNP